ncbi:MAG TPA: 3-keto-5-aminohexanoate cleavage protein, partial [Candidatus Sulfotelmatobacter sp.]|nr:3-keto-5-aminohexanoate cleavage protein [Candidatus Sulfotelmatobacter sp.]
MKTVVTAALTGVIATRDQCPAIPYTPREIGEEARRAAEAGAAIVHIHARTAQGGPDWSVETFAEIFAEVRARTNVIVNFSTGGVGVPADERVAHIRELRPEMAALNMGSMNYAIYSEKKKAFYHDHVFANPFKDIRLFLEAMNAAHVRPEMECFDAGHIANTRPLIDLGVLKPPYQFSLIMGVL